MCNCKNRNFRWSSTRIWSDQWFSVAIQRPIRIRTVHSELFPVRCLQRRRRCDVLLVMGKRTLCHTSPILEWWRGGIVHRSRCHRRHPDRRRFVRSIAKITRAFWTMPISELLLDRVFNFFSPCETYIMREERLGALQLLLETIITSTCRRFVLCSVVSTRCGIYHISPWWRVGTVFETTTAI